MLNHLFAKIEDLEIGPGAGGRGQTAPQCFDISMWQLVSRAPRRRPDADRRAGTRSWTSGGSSTTIAAGRVSVLQVVPSYLEVVLSFLDRHPP